MAASEQAIGPQADAADRPQRIILVGVFAHALIDEAVLEFLEADLQVLRAIDAFLAFEARRPIGMHPFEMHRIDRILLTLEPVARDFENTI